MSPQYMAAGFVHTIPGKLSEYFLEPFTNIFVVIVLISMIANGYMFRKLRKIKSRDRLELINMITIGLYIICSIISAVLVSRLGPHGNLYIDDCDYKYMFIPGVLFFVVGIINVICFVINIVSKAKKDEEYNEMIQRGYYADENELKETKERKRAAKRREVSSIMDSVKEIIDIDGIKEKVNNITEKVKDVINSNLKKDE